MSEDQLYFNDMVNDTCKTSFFKLSILKNLWHFLSHDMKIMLEKSWCFLFGLLQFSLFQHPQIFASQIEKSTGIKCLNKTYFY